MKKWFSKLFLPLLMGIVAVAVIGIGAVYFSYISQKIYEDSTDHLSEIYAQVNRSFGGFIEKNWGLLKSWGEYLSVAEIGDDDIEGYIKEEQEEWGFSDFYFISEGDVCYDLDGNINEVRFIVPLEGIMAEGKPLMTAGTLPAGQEVTVFAVPVRPGEYKGCGYDAIAVCYNNADMASSLNVDAFDGKAKSFVIHSDGTVLLSTQAGGSVFSNYLIYLEAATDLTDEDIESIRSDWSDGRSGILQCDISGIDYCLLYQPVGYQDYIMLSAVPRSAVSAGFLSVQKITMNVISAIFLLVGMTGLAVIIIRNKRKSRRTRTELQYREKMFDVLSNSVDDIFIVIDSKDHHVDYVSPNIERLLGIPVEEARKDIRVMEKCAVADETVIPREQLEEVPLYGNKVWEYEYVHQHTGERRWYRMTVYHMSIQKVNKFIMVLSDRTQDQQMNAKLQEALTAARSANEAKSNFLSNMSHDIRTPMNAIVGFSVLLEKDADKADRVREYTRKITASSHHLLSLINDVLDMSKIESGKTSLNVDEFSLPELLEEVSVIIGPQAKAKTQKFRIHVQGAPPEHLIGDRLRLNQILINLLSNAVKYTPEGGKIDFTLTELPLEKNQFVKLSFTVRDNGIGMSKEFQEIIFSPFSREISSVTNMIQGTGLGMAITKNLVDLMGGIIRVQSETGVGSTFTVELTFALPEKEEKEAWYRHKVKRILVADDEEEICLDIKKLMGETGVDIVCVSDGGSAVEAALKAHEQRESFDVILLDWKMPGQNGVETAQRIRREIGDNIPILVLTSYDWAEIENEAREAGINAFMSKPFFVSTFWNTIKPLFPGNTEEKEPDTAADDNVLRGRLFLVAEDNELNSEILTEMLHMEGAECEVAVNGQEAVRMFTEAAPGCYDMILMDVQMPVMNGYEATRSIRASSHPQAKTIPIAAMTANTFAEDVKNALDAGMDDHLAKPIDMAAVKAVVGRLLDKNKGDKTE